MGERVVFSGNGISLLSRSSDEHELRVFLPSSVAVLRKEIERIHLSRVARKPVFGISEQVRHKPACTVTEKSKDLEISGIRRGGVVLSV